MLRRSAFQQTMPTRVPPKILIVGGGFAGRAAWTTLKSTNALVTLVDEKPFFEFTPSVLRCLIHPHHLNRVTFPHHEEGLSFALGRVSHITETEATVEHPENGTVVMLSIPFDYCIWATGMAFSRPVKSGVNDAPSVVRRIAEMTYHQNRVVGSREVLIIGGGPVGVELAAELAGVIRDDNVSLTLASPRILPRLPPQAGNYATSWFLKRNVRVLHTRMTPSTVLPNGKYEYRSEAGDAIQADTVFDCTGARTNGATNALVAGGVCNASSVNPDGSINVLDTLQLPESPHFFVAGDVARVKDELDLTRLGCEKTAYAAQEAGTLAARNVTVLIRSETVSRRKPENLHRFPNDAFPMGMFPRLFVISLYKYHGILCVGPLVIAGWIPSLVKVVVEFLGVRTARSKGVAALVFRVLEGFMFLVTVLVTVAWKQFRRPSVD